MKTATHYLDEANAVVPKLSVEGGISRAEFPSTQAEPQLSLMCATAPKSQHPARLRAHCASRAA